MITDTSNGKVTPVKDNQPGINASLMMGGKSGGAMGGSGLQTTPQADHGACTCIYVERPFTFGAAGGAGVLVVGLLLARRRRR
jgi:hypothetical protein